MSKNDDAQLNLSNPLKLRSTLYGGNPILYEQMDDNLLNLMREAGIWTDRNYLKNEIVWHEGISYIALQDVAQGTGNPWDDNGTNWRVWSPTHGYGEMVMDTPTAGADITAAWQTLDVFNLIPYTPLGMSFDLVASSYTHDYRGLWEATFILNMTFDDVNQPREFEIRAFNVTDGTAIGTGVPIAVGRNTTGVNLSIPYRVPIDSAAVNDVIRIEIGNATQNFTSVDYEYVSLIFTQIAAARPNVTGIA